MSVRPLATALLLALAVALVLAVGVGVLGNYQPTAKRSPAITTTANAERVVVMPAAGARLEPATVRAREALARSDSRPLSDLFEGVGHAKQVLPIVRYWPPHLRIVSPEPLQRELERGLADYLRPAPPAR